MRNTLIWALKVVTGRRYGRGFDDALNDCLERVAAGDDPETCVESYPAHAAELLPLLTVARAMVQASVSVSYSPEAKARGLVRLRRAIAENGVGRRRRFASPGLGRLARPVAVGFALVILTGVAAGGTTAAAADSVPGDSLYWVKTTREGVAIRFNRSDMGRAQAHAQLANERGREMRVLIDRGRFQDAERLTERLQHHLSQSAGYAGVPMTQDPVEMPQAPTRRKGVPNPSRLIFVLERDGDLLRLRLSEQMLRVQPEEQHRIRRMMRDSDLGYRVFIESLRSDDGPSHGPFWRLLPPGGKPGIRVQ